MCQGKKPKKLPKVIAPRVVVCHSVISAENLSESRLIVSAAIATTPVSWPSTPLAPMFRKFIIATIQKSANKSDRIQIDLVSPKRNRFIWGCERSIILPKGLFQKAMPIPAIIGMLAAVNCTISLRYGFRLYLSSSRPSAVRIVAPQIIPLRCLSSGRKIKLVSRIDINIARPPPRGVLILWITLGCLFFWGSSIRFSFHANLIVGYVDKRDMTVANRKGIKKISIIIKDSQLLKLFLIL